ncbi:O-antigen ligase family protein [Oceanobacillus jeddahense]|uniref:O-antigen ligase family protein n=1 Tax=Oceanobacillus jeddahense TaxID=1462527 RepID=UPI00059589B2|nr:O-antigen ligase family protein [Oceanobacillus jeddahense]
MEGTVNGMKHEQLRKINSWMIAILLTASFTAKMLASLNIINEGAIPIFFIAALLVSYFSAILLGFKSFKINKYSVILIYIVLFNFLISVFFYGSSSYAVNYFIEFLAFGMIIYLLTLIPYDGDKIIYNVMLIGNLILLNPIGYVEFITLENLTSRVNMGASYAMLIPVAATIIFFFFKRKKRKSLLNLISYLSNAYLFILVFIEGTRGAVIAILLLIFLICYIKLKVKISKGILYIYPLFLTLIGIVSYIIFINIEKILLWIDHTLNNMGIEIATVTKTVHMIENQGLTGVLNGRDIVYEKSWNLIETSPIWGNGIGSYANYNNGTYPHNIFIQLLVEGGLFLIIPFIILFLISIWLLLRNGDNNKMIEGLESNYFILFLFIICMPKLMLSSYLWREPAFWLLSFVLISICTKIFNANSKELIKLKKV